MTVLSIRPSPGYGMRGSHPNGDYIGGGAGDFKVSRLATAITAGAASITPIVDTNHTSGPAPLAMYFNAVENTMFPAGINEPVLECSYVWDFDDAGSEYVNVPANHPFGKNANAGIGGVHVQAEGAAVDL